MSSLVEKYNSMKNAWEVVMMANYGIGAPFTNSMAY